VLAYGAGGLFLILTQFFLFSFQHHVSNGFRDHNFCFLFVDFVLFFFSFFVFCIPEREARSWFLNVTG